MQISVVPLEPAFCIQLLVSCRCLDNGGFTGLELDPARSRLKSHKLSAMSLLLLKRHRSFDDQRGSVCELGSSKWSFATAFGRFLND